MLTNRNDRSITRGIRLSLVRLRFNQNRTIRRSGFTLIEMLAVVALMSILVATAILGVRQPLAKAQGDFFVAQIEQLDLLARQQSGSRFGGRREIRFDFDSQTMRLLDGQEHQYGQTLKFGGQVKLLTIIAGGRRSVTSYGAIVYERYGATASYAVQIGQELETAKWLVICGLTGESYVFDSSETGLVLAICSPRRNHPD